MSRKFNALRNDGVADDVVEHMVDFVRIGGRNCMAVAVAIVCVFINIWAPLPVMVYSEPL